jgi:hypothetical protein
MNLAFNPALMMVRIISNMRFYSRLFLVHAKTRYLFIHLYLSIHASISLFIHTDRQSVNKHPRLLEINAIYDL